MYQRHATRITYFYCFPGLTRSPEDSLRSGPGPPQAEHLQKRSQLQSRPRRRRGACADAPWAGESRDRVPAPRGPGRGGDGSVTPRPTREGARGLWEGSVLPSVLMAAPSGPRTGCSVTGRVPRRLTRRATRSPER